MDTPLRLGELVAVGAMGVTPYHQQGITDHYLAVGVNAAGKQWR